MCSFKYGAIVDSFRLPTREAILECAAMGVNGIQLYATEGENSPENLTGVKRRELMDFVSSNGLVFSAICGDLGHGFDKRELNLKLVEKSKRILDLAKELGTDIVTTHIGVIPPDSSHERYKIMQEACFLLSEHADSIGSYFAVETGPEPSLVLKEFLDGLGSKGVSVNMDPANLVMVTGDDPVLAVHNLRQYIVHTHAKDGRRLWNKDPEAVYGVRASTKEEAEKGASFSELPLGCGDVDFKNYLKALSDIGYNGFLTIERETGDNPGEDIQAALQFLKNFN